MRKFFGGLRDQINGIGGLRHGKLAGTVDSRRATRNLPLVFPRQLVPELLDSLPANDPAAQHSRRDLRRINAIMGNSRWVVSALRLCAPPGAVALELGAGCGHLGQSLTRRGLTVAALDRCPPPAHWPTHLTWHQADALKFAGYASYAVIFGNLVFHHFSAPQLAALGEKLNHGAHVIVACEPARYRVFQFLFALIAPLIGANSVTRHDARVSIAAGFRHDELPRALGLDPAAWDCDTSVSIFGAYRLVARRKP